MHSATDLMRTAQSPNALSSNLGTAIGACVGAGVGNSVGMKVGLPGLNFALLVGTTVGKSVGKAVETAHTHWLVLLHERVPIPSTFRLSFPFRTKHPAGLYEPNQFATAVVSLKPSSFAAFEQSAIELM